MSPPSLGKFDVEDGVKLVAIVAISDFTKDSLKILETENVSLKKYNEYHQVVHEIDHMSDLHVDSRFHKQSMKIDNYVNIMEWIDSSIG